jgi:hypothetical protein
MSPFSFFKKKDKDISNLNNNPSNKSKSIQRTDNTITIDFALEEIKRKENEIVKNRLDRLKKTCEEIKLSYETINSIASNIETEEIDVEEEKLAPLIKNTKNTIVKTLKRESSNTLEIPKTFEDLTKFKETIISSINRFGEVTSSHSTVFNTFMKKHANNLRGELKRITENSKTIEEFYDDIAKNKEVMDECKNNLMDLGRKKTENYNNISIIDTINKNIIEKEKEISQKEKKIRQLQALPAHGKSLDMMEEIDKLEKEKDRLIKNFMANSNQLSKAAHKYSYGTSKRTKEIIHTIIKEPLEITDNTDIAPYLEFLNNLKESISTNKILLKDSAKVTQYCDRTIESLPKFKDEIKEIVLRLNQLKDHAKNSTVEDIKKIEDAIQENRESINAEYLRREELDKERTQQEEKSRQLVDETEEQLYQICRKRYKIAM